MTDHSQQADMPVPNDTATSQQRHQPAQLLLAPLAQLPLTPTQLLLLPMTTQLLLLPLLILDIPKSRERPRQINYRGLPIFYTLEYKKSYLSTEDVLRKIRFSYRGSATGERSQTGYGKVVVAKSYSPVCDTSILRSDEVPEGVVIATLDKVFYRLFFPALVEKKPDILTSSSPFALMGPYALLRLHKMINTAESTKLSQAKAMEELINLFGDYPLRDITPEQCAPIMLDKMTQTMFKDSVRLLRQLFAGIFSPYVSDANVWQRYPLPRFKKPYSPAAKVRKEFLNEPLSNSQCCEVMVKAEEYIEDKDRGRLYLAAILMLLLGLEPPEVCAVTKTSVFRLEDYPDYAGLSVRAIVETIGSHKTLTAEGERRQRERQHSLKPLDASDTLQARVLPVGRRLLAIWDRYWETHPDHPSEYLLYNDRNSKRLMSPELLDDWLDETFKDIVPDRSFRLPSGAVKGTYRMSEFFAATAERVWTEECALPEEGIQRLEGLKPLSKHTDAKHYIDFQCDSMLANFDMSQDRWLTSLFGTQVETGHSKKQFAVDGVPGKRLHARFVVTFPPLEDPIELRGAVEIPFAGSIHFAFHEDETPPPCA